MPKTTSMPVGTVTFLFTDIEGSTRLWEQHPRAMRAAVARHDLLLREAIEARGGYVFKTVGDAFCAAFQTAPDALEAALDAQRALRDADWGALGVEPIKARMALHTGVAEVRDDDYFGLPLNRVARLLSTGYGGQILLSLATQQLVRDHLPADAGLKDLGEGGLKDLVRAEHIYQVVVSDLPQEFPPLKSLDIHYSEAKAMSPVPMTPQLHIHLLGDFHLVYDAHADADDAHADDAHADDAHAEGAQVSQINSPRLQALVAYLALH